MSNGATDLGLEITEELAEVDLDQLGEERGVQPIQIKKLRDSHHQIARLLASGMKDVEISAVTGYSQSRISILKNDPQFKQLIEMYRGDVKAAFADGLERLNNVFLDSLTELHERVVEEPESIGTPMLLTLVTEMADRVGHGKQTKTAHLNVNVSMGDRLEAARQRARIIEPPAKTIDLDFIPFTENGRASALSPAPVTKEPGVTPAATPSSSGSADDPPRPEETIHQGAAK